MTDSKINFYCFWIFFGLTFLVNYAYLIGVITFVILFFISEAKEEILKEIGKQNGQDKSKVS